MQSTTDRHPLAWVMDKVAEAEATITLEAWDNNVLSILTSSVEKMPVSKTDNSPGSKKNNFVRNDKEKGQESGADFNV